MPRYLSITFLLALLLAASGAHADAHWDYAVSGSGQASANGYDTGYDCASPTWQVEYLTPVANTPYTGHVSMGVAANGGISQCTGTCQSSGEFNPTVTLTWTVDPGQNYTTEPPPPYVELDLADMAGAQSIGVGATANAADALSGNVTGTTVVNRPFYGEEVTWQDDNQSYDVVYLPVYNGVASASWSMSASASASETDAGDYMVAVCEITMGLTFTASSYWGYE